MRLKPSEAQRYRSMGRWSIVPSSYMRSVSWPRWLSLYCCKPGIEEPGKAIAEQLALLGTALPGWRCILGTNEGTSTREGNGQCIASEVAAG